MTVSRTLKEFINWFFLHLCTTRSSRSRSCKGCEFILGVFCSTSLCFSYIGRILGIYKISISRITFTWFCTITFFLCKRYWSISIKCLTCNLCNSFRTDCTTVNCCYTYSSRLRERIRLEYNIILDIS